VYTPVSAEVGAEPHNGAQQSSAESAPLVPQPDRQQASHCILPQHD
jgi:hypothetical protein